MNICISWRDRSLVTLIQMFDCVLGFTHKSLPAQHSALSRSSWASNFFCQHSSHLRKRSFSSASRCAFPAWSIRVFSTGRWSFFPVRFFFPACSTVFRFSTFPMFIFSQHDSLIVSSGRFNCGKVSPLIVGNIFLVILFRLKKAWTNIASHWRAINVFSVRILSNMYGEINWKRKYKTNKRKLIEVWVA